MMHDRQFKRGGSTLICMLLDIVPGGVRCFLDRAKHAGDVIIELLESADHFIDCVARPLGHGIIDRPSDVQDAIENLFHKIPDASIDRHIEIKDCARRVGEIVPDVFNERRDGFPKIGGPVLDGVPDGPDPVSYTCGRTTKRDHVVLE